MLRDDEVSRHHAMIVCVDGQFMLEDKKSANGSYIGTVRHPPASVAEFSTAGIVSTYPPGSVIQRSRVRWSLEPGH